MVDFLPNARAGALKHHKASDDSHLIELFWRFRLHGFNIIKMLAAYTFG